MFEIMWMMGSLLVAGVAAVLARSFGHEILVGLVAAAIVIANILASKLITMFGLTVPAGVVVYSISFFLTDTLSEFFGRKAAMKAVFAGFLGSLLYLGAVSVALFWPHAFGPDADQAFQATLALSARITVASLITYLISQFHDVWAYDFWGRRTKGKHLWIRNNASTLVSQTLDTLIFITIAFYGVFPILPLILGQLTIKLLIAVLDTPFLYALRAFVFKGEEFEVFGREAAGAST